MPLTATQASDLVEELHPEADQEWSRLKRFADYFRGKHADPYTPKQITPEFRALRDRSKTNLLPLVTGTLVDRLYVDGYRPEAADDEPDDQDRPANSAPWSWWQANGFDARQNQVYEATAKYGYSYVRVWHGEGNVPVLQPRSPRSWYARFDDPSDLWPSVAMNLHGRRALLLDDEALYRLTRDRDGGRWSLESEARHDLGVVPLVRFMNGYPDEDQPPVGEVEPLIDVQDRLNQTVFDLLVAQTYQGAPQQYVAGVVADASEVVKAIAKRVWTFDSPATQVGQLTPADLDNLVRAIDNCLRIYGLKSQTPPHYLLGEMVNIAAEALVAAEAGLSAKVANRQALHGESFEQMFRLAAVAAGDDDAAGDLTSQVVWRATDPRSVGAVVDALGKMVQMLHVPADETWSMIPGVSQQDAARWRRKAEAGDPFVQLQAELDRQSVSLDL